MSFATLGLSEALVKAVHAAGYSQPTPVQQKAIPAVLNGRDLMVAAQTGTGKTGGFALPVLEQLFPNGQPDREQRHVRKQPRVLVLAPTRELAAQVHDSFKLYATELPFVSACIFGGVGMAPQIKAVARGVDVLVACPGRLLDLENQQKIDLSAVEILVLDEADRMLDMGFIHDVKKVLAKLPKQRQNLLFSATFSKDITDLASRLLHNPERIEVTPPNTTVERIEQFVYRIPAQQKRALLAHLITLGAWEQVLVFTRTKHGANRLAEYLSKNGLPAAAIHGNKSQNARTRALADFKDNNLRVLVATDIAARGLDIDQLPYVVNFELPNVEEDYVHRIGRTGRAGRAGHAVSLVAPNEVRLLKNIERITAQTIAEGDLMGFSPEQLPAEEVAESNDDERKARGRRSNHPTARGRRQQNERNEKTATGAARRGRPKASAIAEAKGLADTQKAVPATTESASEVNTPRKSARTSNERQAPRTARGSQPRNNRRTAAPQVPANRDPEVFLDDEIDNFGNRVDYVSPYQGRTTASQRNPRGYQAATAGGRGEAGKKTPAKRNSKGRNTPAAVKTTVGGTPIAAPRAQKPRATGYKGRNAQRGLHTPSYPASGYSRSEPRNYTAAEPVTPKPLIIRKGERLPSLEQLEQLDRRNRREKPAIFKRDE